jgi:hypothetical protein
MIRISSGIVGTVVVLAVVVAGCAGPKYSVDYDPNARFDGLKTYRVEKNEQLLLKARDELVGLNVRGTIEGAIDRALKEKGYAKSAGAEGPVDFVVRYRVDIEQTATEGGVGSGRRDVTEANAAGVNPYVPLVQGEPDAGPIDRQTGRLTIEMVDSKTNGGIWRGTTQQGIPDRASDAAKMKRVEEAIAQLLTRFPPK